MWKLNDAVETTTTSVWNTTGQHVHRRTSWVHMSFYWGHTCQVLFSGWPGSNRAMYALTLLFVFSLAVLVEWFSHCSIVKPGANKVAAGTFKVGLHTVRTGFSYLVMLSVMSFNGGVFIAAVFGHAFGFLLFESRAFRKTGRADGSEKASSDLPTTK